MLNFSKNLIISSLFCITALTFILHAGQNEIYTMNCGDAKVTAIMDTTFVMNSGLIKNGKPDVIKKYLPDSVLTVPVIAYVIKTGKQTILVDAGSGARFMANMKLAGFSPDSIDMVLITHGHFDHVAGLFKDGKAMFPKAKIVLSVKEKALYEDKAIEALPIAHRPYFLVCNQMLKIYGTNVITFNYGESVADGIVAVDFHGHTAGQSGFIVESKGHKLFIAGDFIHMAPIQLPHPEYSLVYDADIHQAASIRKQVLDRLSKEKMPVAAMHLPFPGIGTITAVNEEFVFTPMKWSELYMCGPFLLSLSMR